MLIAASDAVIASIGAAPIAFLVGIAVGWKIGSRYQIIPRSASEKNRT